MLYVKAGNMITPDNVEVLGRIKLNQPDTIAGRRYARRMIYKAYPKLNFFTILKYDYERIAKVRRAGRHNTPESTTGNDREQNIDTPDQGDGEEATGEGDR